MQEWLKKRGLQQVHPAPAQCDAGAGFAAATI